MTTENFNKVPHEFDIRQENLELRLRLEEAEEILRAIRHGEIDGLVVNSSHGEQVFTLAGADHPYRMLIEQMTEGALTLASDGTILYCNRSFAQMLNRSIQKLIGSSFFDLVYPVEIPEFRTGFSLKNSAGRREVNLLKKDGSRLPVCCSINPMLAEGVQCVSMVITDLSDIKERAGELKLANLKLRQEIAERQRVEEALRDNEQRLEEANLNIANILDSITDPFFILDREWRFGYMNQAAQDKYNSCEASVGQNIWELFPKMVGSVFWDKYHEVMNNKIPLSFEAETLYTRFWSQVSVYPFGDGISVLFRDITKRKQAEAALRQSEERFCKAFHLSPVMMAILNMENNQFIEVNQKYVDTIEYSREELIGRTPIELDIYIDKEYSLGQMADLKEQGKITSTQHRIRTKSGKILTTFGSLETIQLDGIECRLFAFQDISEQKEMEATLARLDRLHLIGEMAASIGHEIRNPLTSIRGFLQLLKGKQCYEEDMMFFELMIEELDRANSIISEYLGMARDKKVDLKPNYIGDIINSLYPIIQSDANYREMNVQLDLAPVPQVQVDVNEIRQLILNMARNAIDAMFPGGTLTMGTCLNESGVVLFVKDEGQGLPPEMLDKLGTPFMTTKEKGTGLGLAVCYSIAARHNARIDCETGPTGTTFYIMFPLPSEQGSLF
ncbi:MAG: PAS domain S-box protein [Syntrophomonadaceae bacterium]